MNFVVLFDQAFVSGCRFLIGIFLARVLGVESFGEYALIWTVFMFISAFQIPIILAPMMQLNALVTNHVEGLRYWALRGHLIYSAIASIIAFLAPLALLPNQMENIILGFALSSYAITFCSIEFVRRLLFSEGKFLFVLIIDLICYVLIFSILLLIWINDTVSIAHYLLACSSVFMFVGVFAFFLYSERTEFTKKANTGTYVFQRATTISRPMAIAAIMAFLANHSYVYGAALVISTDAVGGIAAAKTLVGPAILCLMAIENGIVRKTVSLNESDKNALREFCRSLARTWIITFLPGVLVAVFYARSIVEFAFGSEFAPYSPVFAWLSIATLFQLISRIQAMELRAIEKYESLQNASLVSMLLCMAASAVFIPTLGVDGLGLCIMVQSVSVAAVQSWDLRKHYGKSGANYSVV